MTTQHTANPMTLPDSLPRPEDDGGANHLAGMHLPSIALPATSGETVDLSTLPGRTVVYAYPMTGVPGVELPAGWNEIPGARGCTPQTLSFQDQKGVIAALGAEVLGLSTQTPEYQKELSDRLGLSFAILSDAGFELTDAMRLPTMTVEGMRLIKRLTLVIKDGIIEHTFYPVFPPDRATADVVAWLRDNPVAGSEQANHGSGVVIYTTISCPHCKAAKALLTGKGVAFTEISLDHDPTATDAMVGRTGRLTVPQVFVGKRHIGGADDLRAFEESGQLDALLAR